MKLLLIFIISALALSDGDVKTELDNEENEK